ncbi:hypothetical protein OC834_007082 [Tilletia horrida]|nr:hypothetical protein OC834_007082 [Tilletia horrida]
MRNLGVQGQDSAGVRRPARLHPWPPHRQRRIRSGAHRHARRHPLDDYAAKVQAHDSALDDTVEIDLQSGLKHANIVKIIQWWTIDGALVIVMEFAPSGDI